MATQNPSNRPIQSATPQLSQQQTGWAGALFFWLLQKAVAALIGAALGGIATYIWSEEVIKKARLEEVVGRLFDFKKPLDVQRLIDYSEWKCVDGKLLDDKVRIVDYKWSPHEENLTNTETRKAWANATTPDATYERHDLLAGETAFGKPVDPVPIGQSGNGKDVYFEYAADQIQNGHIWTANVARNTSPIQEPIGELLSVPPGYYVRNMTVRFILPGQLNVLDGKMPKWKAIGDKTSNPHSSTPQGDEVPRCDNMYSCNLESYKNAQRVLVWFESLEKRVMCQPPELRDSAVNSKAAKPVDRPTTSRPKR